MTPADSQRPLRADAQRNRELLLAAARTAFAAHGDSAPLEGIARDAGVGIGTLYRNFPTRESLVEGVYAAELDEVAAHADVLLGSLPPDLALRSWMDRYSGFIATKRGMLQTLRSGWESGRMAAPTTRVRVTRAIAGFLAAGVDAGVFRPDVQADDVTALLLGAFLSAAPDRTPEQTGRLLDLIVDALRAGQPVLTPRA